MGETKSTKKSKVVTKKAAQKAASAVSPKKLTKKQKLFCRFVAEGDNLTQAAIKAGYSEKSARQMGSENRTKPYITQATEASANKAQEELKYTRLEHFKELSEAVEFCRKQGNASALVSALEKKGKLCGLYVEKVESNQTVTIKDDWRQIAEDLGISSGR